MTKRAVLALDSNEWLSSQLLQSRIGQAALLYCQLHDAKIALPEIVEREIVINGERVFAEHAEKALSCARQIGNIIEGYEDEIWVPSHDEIRKRIEERLRDLDAVICRLPFIFDHARAALDKVLRSVPPNAPKNQQFKDSAIWHALLSIDPTRQVCLISGDKAFYNARDTSKGLETGLQQEAQAVGLAIVAYPNLADCISSLTKVRPLLDEPYLAQRLRAAFAEHIKEYATTRGYADAKYQNMRFIPVVVEPAETIPLRFEMQHALVGPRLPTGTLITRGEAVYNKSRMRVEEATLEQDEFYTTDDAGFSFISSCTLYVAPEEEDLNKADGGEA